MYRPLLLASLLLSGCQTFHSARNAPGNIQVETPPDDIRRKIVERPSDPGEHVLTWTAGGLAGAGVVTGLGDHGALSASAETSLHLGSSRYTHSDDMGLLGVSLPDTGNNLGVNLGLTAGNSNRPANRAGYAELQFSRHLFYSLAAGWAWDPGRSSSGPQVTGSVGPLYVRSTTMLDRATSLEIGLLFKLPVLSFAWSQ